MRTFHNRNNHSNCSPTPKQLPCSESSRDSYPGRRMDDKANNYSPPISTTKPLCLLHEKSLINNKQADSVDERTAAFLPESLGVGLPILGQPRK